MRKAKAGFQTYVEEMLFDGWICVCSQEFESKEDFDKHTEECFHYNHTDDCGQDFDLLMMAVRRYVKATDGFIEEADITNRINQELPDNYTGPDEAQEWHDFDPDA
jgi:hypothetical protein